MAILTEKAEKRINDLRGQNGLVEKSTSGQKTSIFNTNSAQGSEVVNKHSLVFMGKCYDFLGKFDRL